MAKTLVAYFSPTGTTAKIAKKIAAIIGGDLFEIKPVKPYSKADLDWHDSSSRSSYEMRTNRSFRPEIADKVQDMGLYENIYLGFPIWWYIAPTIINSFLEQYDLNGKTIIPFATSGSSGMGETNRELAPSAKGATLKEGRRFAADVSEMDLQKWIKSFGG